MLACCKPLVGWGLRPQLDRRHHAVSGALKEQSNTRLGARRSVVVAIRIVTRYQDKAVVSRPHSRAQNLASEQRIYVDPIAFARGWRSVFI
jgi:hypothetical protein